MVKWNRAGSNSVSMWCPTEVPPKRTSSRCSRRARKPADDMVGRQRHDRKHAATGLVVQHEQAHLTAVRHRQQRHDHVAQLLCRGGEQLVLGEAVEQRHHGLVIVRAGEQILPARDRVQLAANDRDQAGRLAGDLGREQTDHPQLADHLSLRRYPAHPDVVHPRGAMDGGLTVGLGDHHQRPSQHPSPQRLGHLGQVDPRWRSWIGRDRT